MRMLLAVVDFKMNPRWSALRHGLLAAMSSADPAADPGQAESRRSISIQACTRHESSGPRIGGSQGCEELGIRRKNSRFAISIDASADLRVPCLFWTTRASRML
jgi:hypothetical protein